MQNLTRVLVVNEQTVERKGLSHLLNAAPSIAVIGEAASNDEAVLMARVSRPDVILIDQQIFHKDGPGSLWRIWRENPGIAVLVLYSLTGDVEKTFDFEPGKLHFIHKDSTPEELTRAIEKTNKKSRKTG
ncbi:MAG: response regulator transcription factor [Chloroflexi bacterium]|nr:response regulator transcription factor [Chloroflexota bacterium]